MNFGYFDNPRKEYIVTRPDTPTPWINYIGSGKYGGIVSNTGGGYSFYKDPQHRRVTRYRYNNIPMDRPGRYIYIRDQSTGEYWNPGYQPAQRKLDFYRCRHGMGYTALEGEYKGISASVTYFVPLGCDFEVWLVKIKNTLKTDKKLTIFGYAEFCFWDAIQDQQDVDWVQQINQGRYEDGIITWYPHYELSCSTFFATDAKVSSYDTNLEAFIGKYRSEANPAAVEQGTCSNSTAYRMNGVGAYCTEMELGGEEEKSFLFLLGYTEDRHTLREQIQEFLCVDRVQKALFELKEYWDGYLSKLTVHTPDEEMNTFINIWNTYQCKTTFNWSRFVSLYQLGLGRGMGIRDSAQDILGVVHIIPEEARQLIIKLLQCQYTDGRVYHLFFPLTGEGGSGDAPIRKFDWYSDDHLWLILAVTAYLKETGNFSFLEEEVLYNDKETSGSVKEHLTKAIEFTASHLGPNQIALAGRADWNDTLNLDQGKGIAESVFTSMLFCKVTMELSELFAALHREVEAGIFMDYFTKMQEAVNSNCWDGEWYTRAFDDDGVPIGSGKNEYGKIFINAQSWAVLGHVANPKRSTKGLASVEKHLNSKYGITCMFPAYRAFDETKGGITTYPPGAKENGGIFLHTNPWVMIAETMLGNGARAYGYYRQIIPAARNEAAELLEVEPYVYSQNILGKEHPQFGTGRNSWLTGTAAWNMVAASQHILGIRAGYDCLIVDPCIPPEWPGFTAKRVFRGVVYNIEVKNPAGVAKGVLEIRVDGLTADRIPLFEEGSVHSVQISMG